MGRRRSEGMSLIGEHEEHQVWGGHDPILGALARVLRPALTVECGGGKYSTPTLRRECVELVTVEHDPQWATRMQRELGQADRHNWIVRDVPGLALDTGRREIEPGVKERLKKVYDEVAARVGRHDLLFVDTFAAARATALQVLGPLADVIAVHDTEADHPQGYGLGEAEEVLAPMHRYSYQPHGCTSEWHRFTWTEVFSRQVLDLRALTAAAAPAAMELWGLRPWLVYLGQGPTGWSAE